MRTYDLDTLEERVLTHFLDQGVHIPRWGAAENGFKAFQGRVLRALVEELRVAVHRDDVPAVAEALARRMIGLGPIHRYLDDPEVTEIIVRGCHVMLERAGRIEDVGDLGSARVFREMVQRVGEMQGRQIGAQRPYVLVDLPSGDRFTGLLDPDLALAPAINVRRFAVRRLDLAELMGLGALDAAAAAFLRRCAGRVNLLLVGRPGAGKTTLLNALSADFPPGAQLAIVETFRELQVQHPHPAWAVVRPGGPVTMAQVVNVIYTRMRPDIILVGEVVQDEAAEFVHAVNLGVTAATTIHGNSALGGLQRLETMVLETRPTLNFQATRERIADAIDVVVFLAMWRDDAGRIHRRVEEIAALEGLTADGGYDVTPVQQWDFEAGGWTDLCLTRARRLQERLR